MSTPISASGFYLTMVEGNHNKFYIAITAERFAITNWGRIGSSGQTSFQRMPTVADAEAICRRQAYAKAAKGYTMHHEGLKFTTDFDALMGVEGGVSGQEWRAIADFREALDAGAYAAAADVLVREYEDFSRQLNDLGERFASGNWTGGVEKAVAEFDGLKAQVARVDDAHGQLKVQMSMLGSMLVDALVHQS